MTKQNSLNLGRVTQDSNGDIQVSTSLNISGRFSTNGFMEAYDSYTHSFFKPWTESGRFSTRLDLYGDNSTSELEISLLRDSFSSNAKSGLAIYKPNQTDTLNCYISGIGNSFLNANNGNVGIGTNNPTDKLSVNGGYIKCSTGIRIGSNTNSISYASAIPTSGTWARGDILFNSAPSASGFIGWVCVSAGTPGTWKTWGAISA